MRILVYEHLTAHGLGRDPAEPMHAMYREGLAMRDAISEDLARIGGVEVVFTGPCDSAVLIAPETDGVLLQLAKAFPQALGPSFGAIALTSDKLALANHWREHGVRTPATSDREPNSCETFPVVWKPRDGCGSTATFLLKDAFDVARAKASIAAGKHAGPMILQEFVPGQAASVAFLFGPAGYVPLVSCLQHLSYDGRFHYLGGELPITAERCMLAGRASDGVARPSLARPANNTETREHRDLAERAEALASHAVACVPGLKGYIGVDLVLGDAPDGTQDYAVEINPRLTTSYIGLRALADFNLAEAMLRIATGETPPEMRWKPGRVRFSAGESAGTVPPVDPL